MKSPDLKKVYIDTNVLITYVLGKKRNLKEEDFVAVEELFNNAIEGKYKIVISNFVLAETLHALRSIVTEETFREQEKGLAKNQLFKIANSKDFLEQVTEKSQKYFRDIVDKLSRDTKHFYFEEPGQSYPEDMFRNCLDLIVGSFGTFRVYGYYCLSCNEQLSCSKCKSDSKIVYKGLNAPDLIHILISIKLGCQQFFTMDKYFSTIQDKMPIDIQIIGLNTDTPNL